MKKIVPLLLLLIIQVSFGKVRSQHYAIAISKNAYGISSEAQLIDKFIVIDSAKFVITYELKYVIDPDKNIICNDIRILQIGHNISKEYSFYVDSNDSLYTALTKKGKNSYPGLKEDALCTEIYKNYPSKKITLTQRIFGARKGVYFYADSYPIDFQWQVTNEKKTILSYTCQKATMNFAGRIYEAWFANEIPINDGPYKFCGLPGLILEICDDKGHYQYKCIGIENSQKTIPIKYYSWKYNEVPKTKLTKLIKQAYLRPKQYLSTLGWELFFKEDYKANVDNFSLPYNPIELE